MASIVRARTALALATVYVVWGSTYFAIRVGLTAFPPLLMPAMRFLSAGVALYGFLRLRGHAAPRGREWASALLLGTLLLAGGNGGVTIAEQWVPSGLAAIMITSVPVWAAIFSSLFGRLPSRLEIVGLLVGTAGVVLLNLGQDLRGHPLGAAMLLLAAASWAFGSVLTPRLPLPRGLMSVAAQLLGGGAVLLVGALLHGERLHAAPPGPWLALAYLAVFGSIVAYSAYSFLLKTVSSAVATSYAFVNPLIAVLLGTFFASEPFGVHSALAMAAILLGVFLVLRGRTAAAKVPAAPSPQRA